MIKKYWIFTYPQDNLVFLSTKCLSMKEHRSVQNKLNRRLKPFQGTKTKSYYFRTN